MTIRIVWFYSCCITKLFLFEEMRESSAKVSQKLTQKMTAYRTFFVLSSSVLEQRRLGSISHDLISTLKLSVFEVNFCSRCSVCAFSGMDGSGALESHIYLRLSKCEQVQFVVLSKLSFCFHAVSAWKALFSVS